MADKRSIRRVKKRLQVVFEVEGQTRNGVTVDLSTGGMLIESRMISAPGTGLRGTLVLPSGEKMPFEAEVRWAYRVPSELQRVQLSTMGIQFVGLPEEPYFKLLRRMWSKIPPKKK